MPRYCCFILSGFACRDAWETGMCFRPATFSTQRWRIRTYHMNLVVCRVPSDMQTTSFSDILSAIETLSRVFGDSRRQSTNAIRPYFCRVISQQALRGSVALAYCFEASRKNKGANPFRFQSDTRELSRVMGRSFLSDAET